MSSKYKDSGLSCALFLPPSHPHFFSDFPFHSATDGHSAPCRANRKPVCNPHPGGLHFCPIHHSLSAPASLQGRYFNGSLLHQLRASLGQGPGLCSYSLTGSRNIPVSVELTQGKNFSQESIWGSSRSTLEGQVLGESVSHALHGWRSWRTGQMLQRSATKKWYLRMWSEWAGKNTPRRATNKNVALFLRSLTPPHFGGMALPRGV